MARERRGQPKQGPPVTFRPGVELEQLVTTFATDRGLKPNEVFKGLAALAVAGLDVRYFDLVSKVATLTGGSNAFVRATLHVRAALIGAVRSHGRVSTEPERSRFVIRTVQELVSASGGALPAEVVQGVLVQFGDPGPAHSGLSDWFDESELRPEDGVSGRQGQTLRNNLG